MTLSVVPVPGVPEIRTGDDLPGILRSALADASLAPGAGDIVAVTQKVVSKAEGRRVRLAEVEPDARSRQLASRIGKDSRLVHVILGESRRVVREGADLLITETHHGFVCANAGVDLSNTGDPGEATLLPLDPDRSARLIADRLGCGVIITDTFGRPWREGLLDVAIGLARVPAMLDLRGRSDRQGRPLAATRLGVADALAAAAGLVMGKLEGTPAALVRGYSWDETDSSSIRDLFRDPEKDMFR